MSVDGVLIVDKPEGKTSRQVTNLVSKILGQKKAGHLGTLDPIATGVLPVVLGRATKLIRFLEQDDKLYHAVIRLGAATDTQDRTGKTIWEGHRKDPDPAQVTAAVATFYGEILQTPPMYSALKKNGKPLYKMARQGIETDRPKRKVSVFSVLVEKIEQPDVTVRVRCAPGTYMRTMAHDLGIKLGCGAFLQELTRTCSGPFSIKQAVGLRQMEKEQALQSLIPMNKCLPHFPEVSITDGQARMLKDGVSITVDPDSVPQGTNCRLSLNNELAAVARAENKKQELVLRPLRVFI